MRSARLAIFFVFILLGFGLGSGYYLFNRPHVSADQLRSLSTWGLADYLAKTHPNAKVLVLSNPFATRPQMDQAVVDQEKSGIEGLKAGFKNKMESMKVVYPALDPESYASPRSFVPDFSVTTPISFLFAPNALTELQKENGDYDLWISLIGLPVDIVEADLWKKNDGPRFALLLPDLRVLGGVESIKTAFRRGKLIAIVLTQQDRMFDTRTMNGDAREAFDQRYLLLTEDNVDEFIERHPDIFRL